MFVVRLFLIVLGLIAASRWLLLKRRRDGWRLEERPTALPE
jgi:hypothetical protein